MSIINIKSDKIKNLNKDVETQLSREIEVSNVFLLALSKKQIRTLYKLLKKYFSLDSEEIDKNIERELFCFFYDNLAEFYNVVNSFSSIGELLGIDLYVEPDTKLLETIKRLRKTDL